MLRNGFQQLDSERNILIAICNGDSVCFEILFRHYSKPLAQYAFSILKDVDLVEDIVQEIFLNVWINREKLREIRSFKDYLFILSKNRIINEFRKSAKKYLIYCSLDAVSESIVEVNQSSQHYKNDKEEIFRLLEDEIEKLPTQQQKILKLAKIEHKSYQQIAELLNISIETVRKHLFLANKTLKNNLQNKSQDIWFIIFFTNFF